MLCLANMGSRCSVDLLFVEYTVNNLALKNLDIYFLKKICDLCGNNPADSIMLNSLRTKIITGPRKRPVIMEMGGGKNNGV